MFMSQLKPGAPAIALAQARRTGQKNRAETGTRRILSRSFGAQSQKTIVICHSLLLAAIVVQFEITILHFNLCLWMHFLHLNHLMFEIWNAVEPAKTGSYSYVKQIWNAVEPAITGRYSFSIL
mmetsp:Transcript_8925/g.19261  ORF Transcript_8925/g.19261 Transcript_8925/m.19261 type:complete len:123 (+) Transcript_8925:1537-1905(+)